MSTAEILAMRAVGKGFDNADRRIEVLTSVSLVVERGQRVAITGSSGSGKSTLLHLAAGMDRPDSGHIELLGHDLAQLREPDLTRLRAATVGLVFQDFNLIESLSVSENILLPAWINRRPQAQPMWPRWPANWESNMCLNACRAVCRAVKNSAWPSPGRSSTNPA